MTKYTLLQLMVLRYRFGPERFSSQNRKVEMTPRAFPSQKTGSEGVMKCTADVLSAESNTEQQDHLGMTPGTTSRANTIATYGKDCVTVRITMHSNFGFRSWRCYETIIECLAVGIYLYATFVLTSTLFLNADHAIEYATVMALCLSGVRILSTLF